MSLIYKSTSNNIWFNLALEQKLLKLAKTEPLLYLWKNDKCVVIGKYQNAYTECKLEQMEKDGVKLARRMSGGGAVYQDLGNLCFTVAGPRKNFERFDKLKVVVNALQKASLAAELSGRNDIILEGRKISGSAFQITKDFVSYHGTMLFNVDLTAMSRYLTPSKKKLEAKGVKSVASRVININTIKPDFTMDLFSSTLIEEFVDTFGPCKEIKTIEEAPLSGKYKIFEDTNFRFSNIGNFSIKEEIHIASCNLQFNLLIEQGKVKNIKIYSDTLEKGTVEELELALLNCNYDKIAFNEIENSLKKEQSKKALAALIVKLSFN